MPLWKRELDRRATGPVLNDEDYWHLVYDMEKRRLYIEHEWDHVYVQRHGAVDSGRSKLEITTVLGEGGRNGAAQRELIRLISGLFEEKPSA